MKRHMEWYSVTLIEICMTFYDLSDIPEVNSHMSQKVNLWLSMTLVQFLMTFDDFSVSSSENFWKLYLPWVHYLIQLTYQLNYLTYLTKLTNPT